MFTAFPVTNFGPGSTKDFDFTHGILPSDIFYTRFSSATFYNSGGTLTTVGSNIPRFDYNPYTLICNGLLMETGCINGQTYSNAFNQSSSWILANSLTLTPNAIASPDGTVNASLITNGSNISNLTSLNYTQHSSGTIYTFSAYAKYSNQNWLAVNFYRVSSNLAWYDIKNGTLGGTSGSEVSSSAIQNVGSGWYRISFVYTPGTTGGGIDIFVANANNSSLCNVGDSMYIYGVQTEIGNFATSYIPTLGTAGTRAADAATITSIPWFNKNQGTFITSGAVIGLNTSVPACSTIFSDNTLNNSISTQIGTNFKPIGVITLNGTSSSSAGTLNNIIAGTTFTSKVIYHSGTNLFSVNGSNDGSSTFGSSLLPSNISRLNLGCKEDGSNPFNGWLQSFEYFSPYFVTNTIGTGIPSAATSAGFTVNTFSTNATFSTSTVDTGLTYNSGYKWYFFNAFSNSPNIGATVINGDGSISVGAGTVNSLYQGTIVSAGTIGTSPYYVGTAFGGGGYFEATCSFNPNGAYNGSTWPAWWSMSVEHLSGLSGQLWPGQGTNYYHYSEIDFMEFFNEPTYNATANDWYGTNGTSVIRSSPNAASIPLGIDFSINHRYGMLWIPATGSTNGTISFYFDGILCNGPITYAQYTNQSPPPTGTSTWLYGIIDQQHLVLILDSGNNLLKVSSVNVWQNGTTNNLYH